MLKLLLLDLLKLSFLSFKLLSHNSAFFKVIKSILLFNLFVLLNLRSELLRVAMEYSLFLLFNLLFSFSFFLLLLNDSKELISFLFCLFSQKSFFFLELFFSCNGHFFKDFNFMLLFFLFFCSF